MSFEVINAEQAAVRTIRSYLGILRRYRNTSLAYHGRCVPATYLLAAELLLQVAVLAEEHNGSTLVAREAAKFSEFVVQHDLIKLPSKGEKHGKTSEGEGTVLTNSG